MAIKMKKYTWIGLFIAVAIMAAGGLWFFFPSKQVSKSSLAVDLGEHPVYKNYLFKKDEGVIYMGTQPLYVPTGLITEAMRRDLLLYKDLEELGLQLHCFAFLKGNDVNFFLHRGQLDIGIGGDMPAIGIAARMPVIIPAIVQSGPTSLVTRQPVLIKDLKGKRIAYALGSNAHYMLLNLLSTEGEPDKDFELIPMEVSHMPEALHQGEVDAFAAWEPTVEIAVQTYGCQAFFSNTSTGYIYFSKSLAAKHPEAMKCILAAEIRAINWIKKDTNNLKKACRWALEAGLLLTGRKIPLTVPQYAKLAEKDLLGRFSIISNRIPEASLRENATLHTEFLFLKKIGKINGGGRWETVRNSFDTTLADEITNNRVKYNTDQFDYDDIAVNELH